MFKSQFKQHNFGTNILLYFSMYFIGNSAVHGVKQFQTDIGQTRGMAVIYMPNLTPALLGHYLAWKSQQYAE
jgi:hypothetical protein